MKPFVSKFAKRLSKVAGRVHRAESGLEVAYLGGIVFNVHEAHVWAAAGLAVAIVFVGLIHFFGGEA